jgi:hypothetical protein
MAPYQLLKYFLRRALSPTKGKFATLHSTETPSFVLGLVNLTAKLTDELPKIRRMMQSRMFGPICQQQVLITVIEFVLVDVVYNFI